MNSLPMHERCFDPNSAEYPTRVISLGRVIDLLPETHAPDRIRQYQQAMLQGERFPPISVVRLRGCFVIADGHKRFMAYKTLSTEEIIVEVWTIRRWLYDQGQQLRREIERLRGSLTRPYPSARNRETAVQLLRSRLRHWQRILRSILILARLRNNGSSDSEKAIKARALLKSWRDHIVSWGVAMLVWGMPHLSRHQTWRLARILGWLGYYVLFQKRRVAHTNIDLAFGNSRPVSEKRRIARESFQNFVATLFSLFWGPRLNAQTMAEIADVEGVEIFRDLFARGRGVICLTFHYGDWELSGLAMPLLGFPLTVVAQEARNPKLDPVFRRLRSVTGNRIIARDRAALRLLKALRRGEGVALLVDLNASRRGGGVWVNFFNLPVFNNATVAGLALHTGAAIAYGVAHPLPGGRVKLSLRPEITYERTGDADVDLQTISRKCLEFCETLIRDRPEYWHWSYKRWKHRPSMERGDYPYYSRYLSPTRYRVRGHPG